MRIFPPPSRVFYFIGGFLLSSLIHYIFFMTTNPSSFSETVSKMRVNIDTSTSSRSSKIPIRVVTHNIRYATSYPFEGELRWPERLPWILEELDFLSRGPGCTLICLQEVLHGQLMDIMEGLNGGPSESRLHSRSGADDSLGRVEMEEQPVEEDDGAEWAYIGVGRHDGKTQGEYSPVIYRKSQFKCVSWRTTWLSETPSVPSRGWDAANIRILTHGIFETNSPLYPKTRLVVMSTHLDHIGREARRQSARLILKHFRYYSPLPIVVGGDFNSPPNDGAYQIVTSQPELCADLRVLVRERSPYKLAKQQPENQKTVKFDDDKNESGDKEDKSEGSVQERRPKAVFGDDHTFTGFTDATKKDLIDFVFCGPWDDYEGGNPWLVKGYAVIPNKFEGGVYCSDHRAVVGDLELRPH